MKGAPYQRSEPRHPGQGHPGQTHQGQGHGVGEGGQRREHRYYRYPYNQKHESHGDHAPSLGKRGSKDGVSAGV